MKQQNNNETAVQTEKTDGDPSVEVNRQSLKIPCLVIFDLDRILTYVGELDELSVVKRSRPLELFHAWSITHAWLLEVLEKCTPMYRPFGRRVLPSGISRNLTAALEDHVETAIQYLIDYLYEDEAEDYQTLEGQVQCGHIFESVLKVQRWLNTLNSSRERAKPASERHF
jgi:hypothetical protein